jgi:hypothetical protein
MKLTIAAIVSTIAAMVFCLALIAHWRISWSSEGSRALTSSWLLDAGRGRMLLFHSQENSLAPLGLDLESQLWDPASFRQLFSTPSIQVDFSDPLIDITIPALFALLPCLIAPLLWLRRRRLRKQPAGFAVITGEKR